MDWQDQQITTEEGDEIRFKHLKFGEYDINIFSEDTGRSFVEAINDDCPDHSIGTADSLDAAKQLAHQWMFERIGELLAAAGAEGVWLVRGTYRAMLAYSEATEDVILPAAPLQLSPPHELIVLARFPAGDGRAAGIEFIG